MTDDPGRTHYYGDGCDDPHGLPILCVLCTEPMGSWKSVSTMQQIHRECALRSSMGGIGHLIAHEWWCDVKHDPDAGLTYRQSALLVDEFVALVGVEAAVERAVSDR